MSDQLRSSCEALRSLHRRGDAPPARAVAAAGFRVVATRSAGIAAALGYEDQERAPAEEMLAAAARIADAVDVPVTVDAEAGYGMGPDEFVDALRRGGAPGRHPQDTNPPPRALP